MSFWRGGWIRFSEQYMEPWWKEKSSCCLAMLTIPGAANPAGGGGGGAVALQPQGGRAAVGQLPAYRSQMRQIYIRQ
jgi:hypothetical protein